MELILSFKSRLLFRGGSLYRKANRKSQKLSPWSEMIASLPSFDSLIESIGIVAVSVLLPLMFGHDADDNDDDNP